MEVGSNLLHMGANSSAAIRSAIRGALTSASAGDRILVGVSGGTDSLALASGLFLESAEKALQLVAVIIDHGLQENSDKVSNNAKLQLVKIGFSDIRILKIQVAVTDGIEASARRARYEAFNKLAEELKSKVFFWVIPKMIKQKQFYLDLRAVLELDLYLGWPV